MSDRPIPLAIVEDASADVALAVTALRRIEDILPVLIETKAALRTSLFTVLETAERERQVDALRVGSGPGAVVLSRQTFAPLELRIEPDRPDIRFVLSERTRRQAERLNTTPTEDRSDEL